MRICKPLIFLMVSILALTSSVAAAKYNEAPQLAQLVKEGKLPPVEERLPKEPLVVPVEGEIGRYGGTWRRVALGYTDVQYIGRLTYETLVRWNEDGSDVIPNVAKAYEVNEDSTVFTFYLREGMKWSDGHPFTAEDFEFWWDNVIMNKELTPVIPQWLTINGKPAKFVKVDDYTIRFEFEEPYGLFLRNLAHYGYSQFQYPKHYLKNFHPNFVPVEKLNEQAKAEGLEYWYQLFTNRHDPRRYPECPTICAWVVTVPSPATTIVMERNPYYWKVDKAGNQLPYIDKVTHAIVENPQVLNLKAATGEVDMQLRHILWENLPVFAENAERHNYRILFWKAAEPNNFTLYPNMFHEDPFLRDLFRDIRFRKALSLAIDREEINELCYLGLGRPRQGGVIPDSPFHVEGSELSYTKQDIEEANRLLDEIGLTKRDAEGYRTRPDGSRLSITIILTPVFGPWPKVAELVAEYWRDIGIRTSYEVLERNLHAQRSEANDYDWTGWTNDRGLTPDIDPMLLLPGRGQAVNNSPWFRWFQTNGEQGEQPPEGPELEAYELYRQVKGAKNQEQIIRLMRELIKLNMENLWYIGTVGDLPHIVIVNNNMGNVPEVAVSDWLQMTPGNTWPERYFFKK